MHLDIFIKNFQSDIAFNLMRHRGPDFQSILQVDKLYTVGHQRLSILDTSINGNQPMSSIGTIAYNGEIYNYKEVRKNLEKNKSASQSDSDTEVLLKGLDHHGIGILNKLNGMFAFAYYRKDTKELILARDRFGVKPLLYTVNGGIL